MRLAAMRYKDYVWPHNPKTYSIEYQRDVALHKVPFGRYQLQDLGLNRRIMRGAGAFVGENAYQDFKALATVFYQDGPGLLVHPVWQITNAYFVELSLAQEPRPDYVAYTFTFWEASQAHTGTLSTVSTSTSGGQSGGVGGAVYHTVTKGQTLWGISKAYGVSLSSVIALNPQIKNPNLIYVGQKVRIK